MITDKYYKESHKQINTDLTHILCCTHPGMFGAISEFHGIHFGSSGLRGPDGQDAAARPHIEDDLVLEELFVEHDGGVVGAHADMIHQLFV